MFGPKRVCSTRSTPSLTGLLPPHSLRSQGAICEKGYYCTSALQQCDAALPCGGVEFYCPKGSGAPITVDDGYYTLPTRKNREITRESQAQCLAGFKCAAGRRSSCGSTGYWSEAGQSNCTEATAGYFTVGGRGRYSKYIRTGQSRCPIGKYCAGGVELPAPRGKFVNTTGVSGLEFTTP